MASGGILDRMAAPIGSPSHKKVRQDENTGLSAMDSGRRIQALTCLELTQLVLSHDRDLNLMTATQGLIYKLDKEHPVAAKLLLRHGSGHRASSAVLGIWSGAPQAN